jgi:hypothetical protein
MVQLQHTSDATAANRCTKTLDSSPRSPQQRDGGGGQSWRAQAAAAAQREVRDLMV